MEALQDRIETLEAENHKVAKSKKKVQEEVSGEMWGRGELDSPSDPLCSWMT